MTTFKSQNIDIDYLDGTEESYSGRIHVIALDGVLTLMRQDGELSPIEHVVSIPFTSIKKWHHTDARRQ